MIQTYIQTYSEVFHHKPSKQVALDIKNTRGKNLRRTGGNRRKGGLAPNLLCPNQEEEAGVSREKRSKRWLNITPWVSWG